MKLRQKIQNAINDFKNPDLFKTSINLFKTLGYNTYRRSRLDNPTFDGFYNDFIDGNDNIPDVDKFKEKALTSDWLSIEMLFQLTESEMSSRDSLFDTGRVDNTIIEAYLFFAIELKETDYSRTKLADITRYLNRMFPMPVMVLFKYGGYLTLSVIKRRLHKRDESRDVLKKVTLIKDIKIEDPHRAHIEILFDLSLEELRKKYAVTNFVELHNAWQKTLDSSELNNKFYKELANWYFWAVQNVEFPDDDEKNAEIRNASSVIRLLTRLIFVWFIKEKSLVPGELFDKSKLDDILNYKDKNESSFYKAVLQNLFFATLNQEQSKRAFRRNGQNYNVTNLYRHKKLFKIDEIKILEFFQNIPFLNGGLFECLDKPHPTKKGSHGGDVIIRIDGFSDRDDNVLKIPDFLFFAEEREIDLNEIFGTKNKKYKVKGLINLLNKYKFTIAENTPIEEEIALDPELLGKVFENLLASYNPETKTTARKQTGSFYTPREIVDYMVDESLKASLSNLVSKKIDKVSEEDIQTGLEILFAYTEKEHAFTDTEVSKVIEAVSELKILDPACGSGAFPMGILHKLVFILSKLDEHNERWRELQKQRALKETEAAYNLGSKDERHQRLAEIEKAFDFNTSDYGRKLFLIENSIYGVDIQPIAVQIAKLRFFISLIVDQNINKTKENLGVLPLPNLETKFVAANTLIGVDKPDQGSFADLKTKDLENELLIIRHKHFNAKTQKTKRKYRDEDKRIRLEISQVLKKSGWPSDTAEMLATWDPYDQNQFARFFDMDWMFGIKDGFDIVIGNPPYVRVDDIPKSLKPLYKSSYNTSVGKYDLYYLFFECGINYLSQKGILAYITPNKFCAANSGIALRNLIFNKFDNGEILSTSRLKVFEKVSNYPVISIFRTMSNKNIFLIRQALSINELFTPTKNSYELNKHILSVLPKKIIPINVSQKKIDLSVSLLSKFNVLGNYLSISEGLRIPKSYESEKKTDNRIVKQYQFNKWSMIEDATYITNKDLLKVTSKTSSRYQKIISDKILIAEDALSITATIDYKKYIPQGGIYFGALINDTYDIKVILSFLNSTVLSFIYEILFGGMHMGGGYLRYRKKFLEQLPISKSIKSEQKLIRLFAEKILNAKKTNHTSDTTTFEAEIDARVAHLYNLTEEEYSLILKETNCPDPFRVAALNVYRDIARGKIK